MPKNKKRLYVALYPSGQEPECKYPEMLAEPIILTPKALILPNLNY